jgi:trehalose 2-sulfotransferase
MAKYDSYVICTSPRSGSTLLCTLLASTGKSGKPESYFHRPEISDWLDRFGISPNPAASQRDVLSDIFHAAIAQGNGGTGVFGMRLQRHSFDFFIQKLAMLHPHFQTDKQRFQAAFGHTLFVYLTRPDKVDQAVSHVKAQQTGLWHMATDGTELERLSVHQEPVYNSAEIQSCYEKFVAYDQQWDEWFRREGIDPFRISYDQLSLDPVKTVSAILDCLGLKNDAAQLIEPGVKKLADAISRNWVDRFRSEHDSAKSTLA